MASKSNLDITLAAFRGIPDQFSGRDVGIEVELEGSLVSSVKPFWTVKPENSLRDGGMEYILTSPLPILDVHKALADFEKAMKKCSPKATIRCSTHIHINVMGFSLREIFQAMTAHYLVEDALIETQSPNRHGNLFSLPMSLAEDIFISIKQALRSDASVSEFHVERNRYAALNLAALNKYGSLEFRFLDAYTEAAPLQLWSETLYNLVHNGSRLTPKALLDMYNELPMADFLKQLLGPKGAMYILSKYSEMELRKKLHQNYDYVFELSQLMTQKRFQMPRRFWDEDLDPNEVKGAAGIPTGPFHGQPGNIIFDDVQPLQPTPQPFAPVWANPPPPQPTAQSPHDLWIQNQLAAMAQATQMNMVHDTAEISESDFAEIEAELHEMMTNNSDAVPVPEEDTNLWEEPDVDDNF